MLPKSFFFVGIFDFLNFLPNRSRMSLTPRNMISEHLGTSELLNILVKSMVSLGMLPLKGLLYLKIMVICVRTYELDTAVTVSADRHLKPRRKFGPVFTLIPGLFTYY